MPVSKKRTKPAQLLKDLKAVALWLAEQGYETCMKTVYNHAAEKPAFPSKQKNGYLIEQIRTYADVTWNNPQRVLELSKMKPGTSPQSLDSKARILAADAALKEHKLAVEQGKYYLKSAEDQRDALVIYGIKSAVLNSGAFIVQDLIALVGAELGPDASASIGKITAELRARFNNSVLDVFDGMAKAGGVDAKGECE